MYDYHLLVLFFYLLLLYFIDIRSLNSSKNGPTFIVGDFFPEDIQQIMFEAKYRLRLMTIVTTVVQPNWQQEGIVKLRMSYYI